MDLYNEVFLNNFAVLFTLSRFAEEQRGLKSKFFTTTGDVAGIMGVSQQTASRRIDSLLQLELIRKTRKSSGLDLIITDKGLKALNDMLNELKCILGLKTKISITGIITVGLGEGSYYLNMYSDQFEEIMGKKPFPGTLNLRLKEITEIENLDQLIKTFEPEFIPGFEKKDRKFGAVDFWRGTLRFKNNKSEEIEIDALLIRPRRTHHPEQMVEIVAVPYMRTQYGLEDGDAVTWFLSREEQEED